MLPMMAKFKPIKHTRYIYKMHSMHKTRQVIKLIIQPTRFLQMRRIKMDKMMAKLQVRGTSQLPEAATMICLRN